MGAIADAIAAEPDVRYVEDLPGGHKDISGYDPMDFGDDDDDGDDFTPDEIAEDVTDFAASWKSGQPSQPAKQGSAQAPPPDEDAEPKEKKGNIFAENRILKRDMKVMEQRFSQLIEAINNRNQPQEEEGEEEEDNVVPFEQDPLTHLAQKIGSVDKKMEQQKVLEKQRQQQEVIGKYLEKADEYTNQVIEKIGPQYWDEAMEHLANVRIEDFLERNPNKTRNEASELIGAAIINEKIRLVASGRNPAEVYLKDAFRFGYRPTGATQPAKQEPVPSKPAVPNAKDTIRSQNSKAQNTRTTATLNGAPAKQKLSAKAVVGMAERDFRDLVDDVTKDRRSEPRLRDFILPNS